MAENFDKKTRNLRVSLELGPGLIWAELFRFVDLAREAFVEPAEPVALDYDPQDDQILTGMSLYLDTGTPQASPPPA